MIAGAEKIEEMVGDFFAEWLLSAFWPDGAITALRKGVKLGQ